MYTADNYVLYVACLRRPATTLRPSTSGTYDPATSSASSRQGTESFPAYREHEAAQSCDSSSYHKNYDSDDSVESWSDDDEIWDSDDDTVSKKRSNDQDEPFVFDDEADPEFVAEMEAAFPAHICSKEEMTEDYEEDIEADEETLDFIAKVNAALKREMEGQIGGDVEGGDENSDWDSDYADSDDEASDNEVDQDESDDGSEDEAEDEEVAHSSLAWGMRCTIL